MSHNERRRSFPYYTQTKKKWRNSLRHNLCQSGNFFKKGFQQIHKKGYQWSIIPERKSNLQSEFNRLMIKDIHKLHHTLGSTCKLLVERANLIYVFKMF